MHYDVKISFIAITIIISFALGTSLSKALEIVKAENNHKLGVSRLASSHFHLLFAIHIIIMLLLLAYTLISIND